WQDASGSTTTGSYNMFAVIMAMPRYLERLAQTFERKGNNAVAMQYRQEARRVQRIIEENNTSEMVLSMLALGQ
ncbi:MAG: hypothetical protein KGL95_14220, partial [Patescibacteria group bacterium]|nr:hypothetical protein [Patescibacteria group bacterium]